MFRAEGALGFCKFSPSSKPRYIIPAPRLEDLVFQWWSVPSVSAPANLKFGDTVTVEAHWTESGNLEGYNKSQGTALYTHSPAKFPAKSKKELNLAFSTPRPGNRTAF
jgi:hypothetical protein